MRITKREVIASVVIVAIMLSLGFVIGGNINDRHNDKSAEYKKSIHIDNNTELFQYGMDTNVGNAFIYGDLKAIDTVTFDEIGGEYLYVKKVEEHYNQHTRVVTHTDANGNVHTETEIYYSWDYHDSWSKYSEKISFCDVEFDYGKINIPSGDYIETIKESSRVRYKYYGVEPMLTGTVYTQLSNGTIADNSSFHVNQNIEYVLEYYTTNFAIVIFWILWAVLSCSAVVGFYYLDNRWLED